MKKNLISALIIIAVSIGICWLLKNSHRNVPPVIQSNKVTATTNVLAPLPSSSNPLTLKMIPQTNAATPTNEDSETVLTNYQTLANLKQIKSLHLINNMYDLQNWYSEGNLITFQLGSISDQPTFFKTDTIWALTDKKDNHVRQLVLHSPKMDIDQIRQIGLQLEEAWGLTGR